MDSLNNPVVKDYLTTIDKGDKMKDENKRKLKAVVKGLGEIVWSTLPVVFASVAGFLIGIIMVFKMKGGC